MPSKCNRKFVELLFIGNKVCKVYITSHFIRGEKGRRGVSGDECRVTCSHMGINLIEVGFGILHTWSGHAHHNFHSRHIVTHVQCILGTR